MLSVIQWSLPSPLLRVNWGWSYFFDDYTNFNGGQSDLQRCSTILRFWNLTFGDRINCSWTILLVPASSVDACVHTYIYVHYIIYINMYLLHPRTCGWFSKVLHDTCMCCFVSLPIFFTYIYRLCVDNGIINPILLQYSDFISL